MRTQGTFIDIYNAAKDIATDIDTYGGCPLNPVIRHTTNGVWMLESGLHGEPNADAECSLDVFDNWFYESYSNNDYSPTESDKIDFLDFIREIC